MTPGLRWRAGSAVLDLDRTFVMGIVNVTPDSFSDGGVHFVVNAAVEGALAMAASGADILDVGGESTRPGAQAVPVGEECERVVPVIARLVAELDVPVSVDTRKAEVARAAIDAGASIVNDVTAGRDAGMFDVVRSGGAGLVLMHMRGDPTTMQQLTDYDDVVGEVHDVLAERVRAAVAAGIDAERLAVDPGLGFAKTAEQSLLLMREIGRFEDIGRPIVAGPSRKSFVGAATGTEVHDRLEGTAGAVAWLAANGANVVRVHDVRQMARVVRMVDAIRGAE